MDPLSWLSQLNPNMQNIFLSGLGNLIGNLATQVVNGLLREGTGKVRGRIQGTPEHQALNRVMAQALATTLAALTDDPVKITHFTDLFKKWLAREAVLQELAPLLDPSADTELDLELLTTEFARAGWSAEHLGQMESFEEIVAQLVKHFARYAEKETIFQEPIKIGYLRLLAGRLDELVQQQDTQIALQQRMIDLLQRFAPLDLTQVEQPYLRHLYRQCNDLPLIRERRGIDRDRVRLQRVYVDLKLKTAPSLELILSRLGIHGKREIANAKDAITTILHSATADVLAKKPEKHTPRRGGQSWIDSAFDVAATTIENDMPTYPHTTIVALRNLKDELKKPLLEELSTDEETFDSALSLLTPLEALREHRQLVILGDPGSGKSTYTQRLAALFAATSCHDKDIRADLAQDEVTAIETLLTTMGRPLLPLRLILSQWAKVLSPTSSGCADDLIDGCVRLLAQTTDYGPEQKKHFIARLQGDEPTVLLLLDGLDEVSDEAQRRTILKAIAAFQISYPRVPMIVTCRIRPYAAMQSALDSPAFTLAPLELPQIEHFLERWYMELRRAGIYESEERATECQRALVNALQTRLRSELFEMAQTPLLLTSMAHTNYWDGLPDSRAKLYESLVNQLLYEWERQKQGENEDLFPLQTLLDTVKLDLSQFHGALNQVAYELHNQSYSTDTVDISHATLRNAFAPLHPGPTPAREAWVAAMLELITDRSGLIYATDTTPGTEMYRFSHRTFQEYLAARQLATGDTPAKVQNFQTHIDDEGWYEAILLGIGYMAGAKPPQIDDTLTLMVQLLPETFTPQEQRRVLLFGEAYIHILRPERAQQAADKERANRVHQRLIKHLTTAMQHPDLPPRQRLDAGLLLAELEEGPADVDELVTINAGPKLGIEFKIGKYPVTNAQFRRFFDDNGYSDERWWSEEGVKAKAQYSYREPRYWNDNQLNRSSQPVVGISWYEAEAYSNWLTVQWRADNTIDQEEKVRLPTRVEWEAAARNKHGKEYPWGSDAFDLAHANTEESNLDQTSPVHMYPLGITAGGVWDMAGNVWEWTRDLENNDSEIAHLKGGCYYWDKDRAKASAASAAAGYFRRSGFSLNGFRVVVVPISR